MLRGLFALFLGLSLPAAWAADPPAPVGHWQGTLKVPNREISLAVDLYRNDGGAWAGDVDFPPQVEDLALSDIKVDGASVSFRFTMGPGNPAFEGKLSADGKTLSGTFTQGTASLPLELQRTGEAKIPPKRPLNEGPVEVLEGVWEGKLETPQGDLRLRFRFSKAADGTITGFVDSLDQRADGIPVSFISRSGDAVKLEVKVVGGSYDASLSKDAASLTGTWRQSGGELPLTIRRNK